MFFKTLSTKINHIAPICSCFEQFLDYFVVHQLNVKQQQRKVCSAAENRALLKMNANRSKVIVVVLWTILYVFY